MKFRETVKQYRFMIGNEIGPEISEWFEGLQIENGFGFSLLTGPQRDQAELFGTLIKIRDLGFVLISVCSPDECIFYPQNEAEKGV